MFGNLETLPNDVFGDRNEQGSCSFSGSVGTDIQCNEVCKDVEECDAKRDIRALFTC